VKIGFFAQGADASVINIISVNSGVGLPDRGLLFLKDADSKERREIRTRCNVRVSW
jgi:hypothetical protein